MVLMLVLLVMLPLRTYCQWHPSSFQSGSLRNGFVGMENGIVRRKTYPGCQLRFHAFGNLGKDSEMSGKGLGARLRIRFAIMLLFLVLLQIIFWNDWFSAKSVHFMMQSFQPSIVESSLQKGSAINIISYCSTNI
jgi:hypothetical protein